MKNTKLPVSPVRPYKAYSSHNFRSIYQLRKLSEEQKRDIEIVSSVLPFKVNNYVIDELINWNNVPYDPMFVLTFPQKDMLLPHHFSMMKSLFDMDAGKDKIRDTANKIRILLNPHPAGQMELNVPEIHGHKLTGVQHKYKETVLFFPNKGQTCHAYCTFCFRWPQFVGMDEFKFAMKETELLVEYLKHHPEVTGVLFTGGDPLVMSTKALKGYIEPLLSSDLPNLRFIRLGTKALSYWPYKFTTDSDADDLMRLFEKVKKAGKHLAVMAHFNHHVELSTDAVKEAINRIQNTGAIIRTQSPIMRHINDSSDVWSKMWREQVHLGLIPYYMFIARDTGAQHYFAVPLVRAWEIFHNAYKKVSGICRTVRGPSMSCTPGKVQIMGVSEVYGEKVIILRMLQGRNPDWVHKPFFADYDSNAIWLNQLRPAFGKEKFFFEEENLENIYEFVSEGESYYLQ
jgi:KamA family protein